MEGWRNKKPSPSMAVALLSLFIALTGVATAGKTKTVKLKPNQVKAVNIAPGAVTEDKLADSAVTSRSIRTGSVVEGKIKESAVTETAMATNSINAEALRDSIVNPAKLANTFPNVYATRTSDYPAPDVAFDPVELDAELYDPLGMHSNTTNNDRITFTRAGIYRVTARVAWQGGDAIDLRRLGIYRNGSLLGSDVVGNDYIYNVPAGTNLNQDLTATFNFNAGDYIQLFAFPGTTGVTIDQQPGESPVLDVQYIAPPPS
jgi:hypothetical protein